MYSIWGYRKGSPALIFPITQDGQVVAVKQFRHGSIDFNIETPGGLPKGGIQSPKEVAEAELLEETGYQAAEIVEYAQFWADAGAHDLRFTPFIGLGCTKVHEADLDKNEVMETMLVPLKEWYRKIQHGEIADAKVIALSLLVLPLLKERLGFNPY